MSLRVPGGRTEGDTLHMPRKPIGLLAILALLAAVAAVALHGRGKPGAEPVEPIRIGVQDNTVCALLFIAERNGLLRQEHLRPVIHRYPSGKLALDAMFKGDVDVATVADLPIVLASFERSDFALFATIATTDSGAWLLARKDHGVASPDDLRGKTIGTQRNSAVHFFLSFFLLRHHIPEDEVRIEFLDAVQLPDALLSGRVSAISMRNPFMLAAKSGLGTNALEMTDSDIYRQTFNLVAPRAYLREYPAPVRHLLKALLAAEQIVVTDGESAREIAAAWMGPDRRAECQDDWPRHTFAVTLEQSLFLTIEDQARWAMGRGLAAGGMPNFEHLIDAEPLRSLNPRAVSIIR